MKHEAPSRDLERRFNEERPVLGRTWHEQRGEKKHAYCRVHYAPVFVRLNNLFWALLSSDRDDADLVQTSQSQRPCCSG